MPIRTTIRDFQRDIETYLGRVDEAPQALAKKLAFDLHRKVIVKTPVDTGRAQGSWFLDIRWSSKTHPPVPKGKKVAQSPEQAASSQSPSESTESLVWWLFNNLPYIESLEFGQYPDGPKTVGGFSKRAPQGMLRVSIAEAQEGLQQFLTRLIETGQGE